MSGGYDLYGRWYPNEGDAINAEMAQCAVIDADRAQRRIQEMEQEESSLHYRIQSLEHEIEQLHEAILFIMGKEPRP